jgi:hypothetical protein
MHGLLEHDASSERTSFNGTPEVPPVIGRRGEPVGAGGEGVQTGCAAAPCRAAASW